MLSVTDKFSQSDWLNCNCHRTRSQLSFNQSNLMSQQIAGAAKQCRQKSEFCFNFYSLTIEEQEEIIMKEYGTGWAARAAQNPEDEILKSGVQPVRIQFWPFFLSESK